MKKTLFVAGALALLTNGQTVSAQPAATSASSNAALASEVAEAETSPAAVEATTSISAPFKLEAPTFGPMKLKVGAKTTDTSGRLNELQDEKGRRLKQKHEYYLGAVHKSGWGAYVQGVTTGTNYGDSSHDRIAGGDGSVTILHPDLYKGDDLTLSGQLRRYIAVDNRSRKYNQRQWAYYLYATEKLPARWTVWNQATPRYFDQDYYEAGNTTYYFEDITSLSKSVNTWFAYGVSQWTQVEWHSEAPTGTSVDGTLFTRFILPGNFFVEPRFTLPLAVRNNVYDAATGVALNAFRAELYAQVSL